MVRLGLGFKEGVSVRIRVGLKVRIVLVRVGGFGVAEGRSSSKPQPASDDNGRKAPLLL